VKLLYCAHCGDIVRLFPEKRFCLCGKSWGHYLDDGATTVQTWPGLSLGIANPDFVEAEQAFAVDVKRFSPLLAMRCWINPVSEPDVKFVAGVLVDATDEPSDPVDSQDRDRPHAGDQDGGGSLSVDLT
jgi:hypothetical protein